MKRLWRLFLSLEFSEKISLLWVLLFVAVMVGSCLAYLFLPCHFWNGRMYYYFPYRCHPS